MNCMPLCSHCTAQHMHIKCKKKLYSYKDAMRTLSSSVSAVFCKCVDYNTWPSFIVHRFNVNFLFKDSDRNWCLCWARCWTVCVIITVICILIHIIALKFDSHKDGHYRNCELNLKCGLFILWWDYVTYR